MCVCVLVRVCCMSNSNNMERKLYSHPKWLTSPRKPQVKERLSQRSPTLTPSWEQSIVKAPASVLSSTAQPSALVQEVMH